MLKRILITGAFLLGRAAAGEVPEAMRAFAAAHCIECHDAETREGGLDLESLTIAGDPAVLGKWVRVHDRVRLGEMPPAKRPRPGADEREAALRALGEAVAAEERLQETEKGRTGLRRLNRVQHENSLRALLGVPVAVKEMLPPDTPAHGFDTVAEGLRLSALHLEKYLEAADAALDAALVFTEPAPPFRERLRLKDEKSVRENLDTPEGKVTDPVAKAKHQIIFRELPDAVVLFSDGYSPTDIRRFHAAAAGTYRIRVRAWGWRSGGEPVTLLLQAHQWKEKRLLGSWEMPPDKPREVEVMVRLEKGELLHVAPQGTGYDDKGKTVWQVGGPRFEGTGLAVDWIEIEGPLGEWPPPSVKLVLGDVPLRELPPDKRPWVDGRRVRWEPAPADPAAAATEVVTRFAGRAFRRPLREGEAAPLVALAHRALADGRPFLDAVRAGLRGVLTAPQFLLVEEGEGALDDHELAVRLAFFLWSAPPDEALLAAAAAGRLTNPDGLRAETERLLRDPRAREFVRHFTGQWLDLRNIAATTPDRQLHPEFDAMLQLAMVGESEAFFAEVLERDLPARTFLDSDFVMVNRRLARHYGLDGVKGEAFERVSLPAGSPRGGVLGQAAVLKVTANGTVSSPVMRGAWVMKRLLGRTPAPPPPNVGSVEPDTRGATTIRDQLAKHRRSETCASCHRVMDPPGFALENFDVIGGWRERYRSLGEGDRPTVKLNGREVHEYRLGPAVDASGELEDGRRFTDIRSFKALLVETETEQVARTLAGKLTIYATGAGIRFCDRAAVEAMLTATRTSGHGLRSLVHAVVQSDLFRRK